MEINKIIIGLEVHIELKTASKMFCSCNADHFAKKPNTQTCPTCLGLPGALPVPNKKAIDSTIIFGLSVSCEIPKKSHFDRKNYFYPDLPKGYQISQYDEPFAVNGKLKIKSPAFALPNRQASAGKQNSKLKTEEEKSIRIRRVHLEEDTAKLLHETIDGERITLIDFNRSGVPLMEIVSEPDLNSSDEAKDYLEKIQQLVRYLEIADADMEKGSMRCEPNVNLEIIDNGKVFYTPIIELKNINSFKFVKKAIDFEIKRQFEEFEETHIEKTKGNKQTRGWDDVKQITVPQRTKEEANDYRYFPEPDIPPFQFTEKDISNIKDQISKTELPREKMERFIKEYGLSEYQAGILTEDREGADYFEKAVELGKIRPAFAEATAGKGVESVEIANIIINKRAPEGISPDKLIEYILCSKQKNQISDEELDKIIERLLSDHPEVVDSYKKGKIQALGMIVGLVKKETGVIVSVEKIIQKIAGAD